MLTVSVNMMVRNEPFAVFALASIAQFADEILIYDTGSDDGTYEQLIKFSREKLVEKNIVFKRKVLPDGHKWVNTEKSPLIFNMDKSVSKALGDIRREMQAASNGDFIWILDGDEVYHFLAGEACRQIIDADLQGKDSASLWFLDLINAKEVRHYHQMGRIFRKNAVEVRGDYPCEMHTSLKTGLILEPKDGIMVPNHSWPVCHYESIVKPWRKDHKVIATLEKPYIPEVFMYFPEWSENLKKHNLLGD